MAICIIIGLAFMAIEQCLVGELINQIIRLILVGVDLRYIFVLMRVEGNFATLMLRVKQIPLCLVIERLSWQSSISQPLLF